jgi:hypothetical protein
MVEQIDPVFAITASALLTLNYLRICAVQNRRKK